MPSQQTATGANKNPELEVTIQKHQFKKVEHELMNPLQQH
jgi:hypothetical protein